MLPIPPELWAAALKDAAWWMHVLPVPVYCTDCGGAGCHWCYWTGDPPIEYIDEDED